MEYKVLETTLKTTSIDEALNIITTLPQPVCIAIIKNGYDIIKEHAYQDIVGRIKKKIPVMCETSAVDIAELMLARKQNVVLRINDDGTGRLHKILSNYELGNIAGIRVKSALHSSKFTADRNAELSEQMPGFLSCQIIAYL